MRLTRFLHSSHRAHCLMQELYAASGAPPSAPCSRAADGDGGKSVLPQGRERSCPPSPSLSSINSARSLPSPAPTQTHNGTGTGTGTGTGGGTAGGSAAFLAMSDAFGRSLPSDVDASQGSRSGGSGGRCYNTLRPTGPFHPQRSPIPSMAQYYAGSQPLPLPLSFPPPMQFPHPHPPSQDPRQSASVGIAQHWESHETPAQLPPPFVPSQCPPPPQGAAAHTWPQQSQAQESLGRWDQQADQVQSQDDQEQGRSSELWTSPLSVSSLLQLGVPLQEVAQLVDLQTFFLRNVRDSALCAT